MISWRRINWIVALMKLWPIYNCTVVGAPIIHTLIHIMMMLAALSKFNLWMRWNGRTENLQAWDNRLHPFKGEEGENYFPTGLCWVLPIAARSGGNNSFIEDRLHLYQLGRVGR